MRKERRKVSPLLAQARTMRSWQDQIHAAAEKLEQAREELVAAQIWFLCATWLLATFGSVRGWQKFPKNADEFCGYVAGAWTVAKEKVDYGDGQVDLVGVVLFVGKREILLGHDAVLPSNTMLYVGVAEYNNLEGFSVDTSRIRPATGAEVLGRLIGLSREATDE